MAQGPFSPGVGGAPCQNAANSPASVARETLFQCAQCGQWHDELLTDAGGACLWVSSQTLADLPAGVRDLGSVPWSPRTPVVRPTPG